MDMIGINIGNKMLVSRAFKEDGMFFIIYVSLFIWFILKDKIGKYLLSGWLIMWFIAQFLSHWYSTIFGPSEGKIRYFNDTIKLIPSTERYIPDLYHIVLHVLILATVICLIWFCIKEGKPKTKADKVLYF
jgi:hypothetical protein